MIMGAARPFSGADTALRRSGNARLLRGSELCGKQTSDPNVVQCCSSLKDKGA